VRERDEVVDVDAGEISSSTAARQTSGSVAGERAVRAATQPACAGAAEVTEASRAARAVIVARE